MGELILLICTLPPLAVMIVAAVHGLRTGSPAVLSMLVVSALVLSASAMLPNIQDKAPAVLSVRFTPPNGSGLATPRAVHEPVHFADRWEAHATYR